jgi:hypothetical protein
MRRPHDNEDEIAPPDGVRWTRRRTNIIPYYCVSNWLLVPFVCLPGISATILRRALVHYCSLTMIYIIIWFRVKRIYFTLVLISGWWREYVKNSLSMYVCHTHCDFYLLRLCSPILSLSFFLTNDDFDFWIICILLFWGQLGYINQLSCFLIGCKDLQEIVLLQLCIFHPLQS